MEQIFKPVGMKQDNLKCSGYSSQFAHSIKNLRLVNKEDSTTGQWTVELGTRKEESFDISSFVNIDAQTNVYLLGHAIINNNLILFITLSTDIDYKDIKAVEIEFSVNTKYAPDVPLREDSYIKINSFYARIPEGISLDLGEQIPSKEETNE
jgi:hypothetical protein